MVIKRTFERQALKIVVVEERKRERERERKMLATCYDKSKCSLYFTKLIERVLYNTRA